MQRPIGGTVFAAVYLAWFAFRVHGWYHTDAIEIPGSTANGDDYDLTIMGSYLASLVGAILAALDLQRLTNSIGGDVTLGRIVLGVNALLWVIVYYALEWLGTENYRWIGSL